MENLTSGFQTFAALVALIPIIVEFAKSILKIKGFAVQLLSWVLGVLLTFIGWKFSLGFLAGMEWWLMLLYGFGASLAANGVFSTGLITLIIGLFKSKS